MMRLALAILLVAAACPGNKAKPGGGSGSGTPVYAKKMMVGWGFQQQASQAEVFLETTDETGKQTSYPLGTFAGQCEVKKPAEDMRAITGVACKAGATGIELHAVIAREEVVVLELRVDDGVIPDPMARKEIRRVKAPGGAAIEAAP
jgi:hypothetical protein